MAERESGLNIAPETQLQFTRPNLHIDNEIVQPSPSRFSRVKEQVSQKKLAVGGAAAIAITPTVVGFAEGLEPRDALIYGALQWLTLGSDQRSAVSESTQEILSGGIQTVAEAGVFATAVKFGYDHVNKSEKKRVEIVEGTAEIKPEGEQIIVLGGSGSRVIDALATSDERGNFIPVLESSGAAQELLFQYDDKVKNGESVYLNLGVHANGNRRTPLSYLETHAWDKLKLKKDNLIQSTNGHRYLLVVGCGESADRELSFNPLNVDVTHDDLRSAVVRLNALLLPDDLVEQRDIIDVYIGNADMNRKSAENRSTIKDRELARKTGVDIYVDTWALVLRELAEKIAEEGSKKASIATINEEYKDRFHKRYAKHMVEFAGCDELEFVDIEEAGDDVVWIVYEGPSDETFLTAKRLRKLYPERRVIALLSNDKVANYIQTAGVENVEFICASTVLAETIIGVKDLIKNGYNPSQIQELLDEYAPSIQPDESDL